MTFSKQRIILILMACLCSAWVHAELSLPIVFSDHMVLQCNAPVPVWGKAGPGEEVNVTFSDQHLSTLADEQGHWRVREHKELSVNSFHYNHIFPLMSMLLDYMVTDVFKSSNGQTSIPSEFIEGYAYLQNKFYGHEPGEWYGMKNAYLWMPQGVLNCDNVELNYLTARSGDKMLIAFTNQSNEEVTATITLNKELIGKLDGVSKQAVVRQQNNTQESLVVDDGIFKTSVAAKGITAVEIGDVEIVPAFQTTILSRKDMDAWSKDYLEMPFGNARAMILRGAENDNAYIYLQSDDAECRAITLHYQQAGAWKTIQDDAFPYEFTVPLDGAATEFRFYCESVSVDGKAMRSEEGVLPRAKE